MNTIFRILFVLVIGSFMSCAESSGKKKDDKNPTNTENTGNIDGGNSEDTNTGNNGYCQCDDAKDPCCQSDACHFEPEGVVCDDLYETQKTCPEDSPVCGGTVSVRHRQRLCSGDHFGCFGEVSPWTEWQVDTTCKAHETCAVTTDQTDGGTTNGKRVSAPESCAIPFGQKICFSGHLLKDCPAAGCPDPPPSMTESATFLNVGSSVPGEVVLLELNVPPRFIGSADPFFDIYGELRHGGKAVNFYNQYQSKSDLMNYNIVKSWRIPHFFAEVMNGEWELYLEDRAYSNAAGGLLGRVNTNLTQWCLTFIEPGTWPKVATGTWESKGAANGIIGIDVDNTGSRFEMQITDIVKADTDTPTLCTSFDVDYPAELAIVLRTTGQTIQIKQRGDETIEESYPLTALQGQWLTGRYQLQIENSSTIGDIPNLNAWSINLGEPCDLPASNIGLDPGPDPQPDAGADSGQ